MRRLALLLTLSWSGLAWAARPELSGAWVLDEARSQSMDPILEARGVSWFERQAMSWIDLTTILSVEGGALIVAVESSVYSRSDRYVGDGEVRVIQSEREGTLKRSCRWTDAAFIVETELTLPDGRPALWRVTRSVTADGATLLYDAELRITGGETLTARRVMTRAPTP